MALHVNFPVSLVLFTETVLANLSKSTYSGVSLQQKLIAQLLGTQKEQQINHVLQFYPSETTVKLCCPSLWM